MTISRHWNGRILGTNTGNVAVVFQGEDDALTGVIRLNDFQFGLCLYDCSGTFKASQLKMNAVPRPRDDVELGSVELVGSLTPQGDIQGSWTSSLGTGGTFMLYPHASASADSFANDGKQAATIKQPDQLHTGRQNLGSIEIQYNDIIGLAEEVQQEFTKPVVVTLWGTTEQSVFLNDFKTMPIHLETARLLKIFASDPEENGVSKVVSIEFGPEVNTIMVQGPNESWVLGKIQTLRRDLRRFERSYFPNVLSKFGVNLGAILLIGAVIFIPDIKSLYQRAVLLIGVVLISNASSWIQRKYIPHAAIYIKKKESALAALGRKSLSWAIGIVATVLASLLAAYLKGVLNLPKLP